MGYTPEQIPRGVRTPEQESPTPKRVPGGGLRPPGGPLGSTEEYTPETLQALAAQGICPTNEGGFVQLMPGGQAIAVGPEVLDQTTNSESKRISELTNKYLDVRMGILVRKIGLNSSIYLCFVWD